jgi:hypothetical protein
MSCDGEKIAPSRNIPEKKNFFVEYLSDLCIAILLTMIKTASI